MLERLNHGQRTVWALDTGLEPQGLEASALVRQTRMPAWFFDGQWTPWPIQGVLESRGTLRIFGPDLGEFLDQGWRPLPLEEEQNRVSRFLEALPGAPERTGPWLCLDHHRFLVLPEYFLRIDHPGLKDWKAFSSPGAPPPRDRDWRAGALVWRLLSGSMPYGEGGTSGEEDLRDRQRNLKLPPSSWLFPYISPPLAEALDRSLDFTRQEAGIWQGEAMNLPAPGPQPSRDSRIIRWEKKQLGRFSRKRWWRRNRLRASLALVGAVILTMLAAGTFAASSSPGQEDFRPPREIVQAYYQGINDIRDQPLRNLTRGTRDPVLQKEADELARLFIFSELQMTQIGGPGVLSARMWEEAGRPSLGNFQTLFGITNLILEERQPPAESPGTSFWTARYRKWYSVQEQEGGILKPREWDVREVTDQLELTLTPQGWKILSVDRSEQPVPLGALQP